MQKLNTSTITSQNHKQNDEPVNLHNMIELHVPDFKKTKELYEKLGFETIWERTSEGFKGYLVMKYQKNIICFWGGNDNIYQHEYFSTFPSNTTKGFGVEIVHLVDDVDSLYERAKKLNCVVEDLKLKPWGVRDFRIVDCWGFYIRFSELHNVLSEENAVA